MYSSPNHVNHIAAMNGDAGGTDYKIRQELINLKTKLQQLENVVSNPGNPEVPGQPGAVDVVGENVPMESDYSVIEENKDLLIGLNPVGDEDETINFWHKLDGNGKRVPMPTFPFLSLLRLEPGIHLFWIYFDQSQSFKNVFFNRMPKTTNKWLYLLHDRAQKGLGPKYIKQLEEGFPLDEVKLSVSSWGGDIGITYHPVNLDGLPLQHKMLSVLQKMAPINEYFLLFLEYLYPFFPLIDEQSFRTEVSRITGLGTELTGEVVHIKFEKFLDPAIMALVFYISKLSYLCLFHNDAKENLSIVNSIDTSPSIQRRKRIMSHPVPIDAIHIAEECMDKFNLVRKQDLWVLQALIFSRVYDLYSPEVGDSLIDGESQAFNGVVIQIAFSLGLNRDPDYSIEEFSEPIKNLRRKIWYFLINLDISDTTKFGTTVSIRSNDFDTKIPHFSDQNSNIANRELEKEAVKVFCILHPLFVTMSVLAELVVDFNLQIQVLKITNAVRDLEVTLARMFGRFKNFLKLDVTRQDFFLILSITFYLRTKMFLAVVYFRLYIYYYEKGNTELEFFYHKKLFTLLFYELGEVAKVGIFESKKLYGIAFTLMLSPILGYILQMSAMQGAALCLRLMCTIRELRKTNLGDEESISRLNALDNLLLLSLQSTKDSISKMTILGNRYFFSWKNKKAFVYSLRLLQDELLYESEKNATKGAILHYSNLQLDQMVKILRFHSNTTKSRPDENAAHHLDVLEALVRPESLEGMKLSSEDENELIQELQTDNFWCQLHNINVGMNSCLVRPVRFPQGKTNTTAVIDDSTNQELQQFTNDLENFGASFFDMFLDVNFKFT